MDDKTQGGYQHGAGLVASTATGRPGIRREACWLKTDVTCFRGSCRYWQPDGQLCRKTGKAPPVLDVAAVPVTVPDGGGYTKTFIAPTVDGVPHGAVKKVEEPERLRPADVARERAAENIAKRRARLEAAE